MGISEAMSTAVSGLSANATAVTRISENIANAGTTGYKRTFADMVTTTTGGGSASGVKAVNGSNVGQSGSINATGSEYDLAISGSGFFVVSKNPNETSEANFFLTRVGSFRPDANGYLVNSAGYYLAGFEYDTSTGAQGALDRNSFGSMSSVKIGDLQLPAQPSTTSSVTGNLPAQETGVTPPGAAFLSSMEFFTQLGRSENLILSWQPTADLNVWTLTVSDTTNRVHGAIDVTFNNSGDNPGSPKSYAMSATQPVNPPTLTLDPVTGEITLQIDANGDQLPLTMALGKPDTYEGITQFVGDFTPQRFTVDGSGQTSLARTETDTKGTVWGVFDDGRRLALYDIPVAQVTNPNALTLVDGNAYQINRAAGTLTMETAGQGKNGTVIAGALEASTVDVSNELTDLIRVQRAYSSNAKIITASDEMLQEVNNLKR